LRKLPAAKRTCVEWLNEAISLTSHKIICAKPFSRHYLRETVLPAGNRRRPLTLNLSGQAAY
jgi:hypothetical protein